MGWKNIKEHYKIGHLVHVNDKGICIGSPYINDIIVIDSKGLVIKRYNERSNDELRRYQDEMDAEPETLKRLIEVPDRFAKTVMVYTYLNGDIIEKPCEEPGWPNTTHDGELMYDNSFSTDKQEVVAWAKRSAMSGIRMARQIIDSTEQELRNLKIMLSEDETALAKLETTYPTMPTVAATQEDSVRLTGG